MVETRWGARGDPSNVVGNSGDPRGDHVWMLGTPRGHCGDTKNIVGTLRGHCRDRGDPKDLVGMQGAPGGRVRAVPQLRGHLEGGGLPGSAGQAASPGQGDADGGPRAGPGAGPGSIPLLLLRPQLLEEPEALGEAAVRPGDLRTAGKGRGSAPAAPSERGGGKGSAGRGGGGG